MKALVLWLALSAAAFARLGETTQQIESRYGPATAVLARHGDGSARIAQFQFQGMTVEVVFEGGFSVKEAYAKPRGTFSRDEVVALLAINTNGSPWQTHSNGLYGEKYMRQDGSATASGKDRRLFTIELTAKRVIGPMKVSVR